MIMTKIPRCPICKGFLDSKGKMKVCFDCYVDIKEEVFRQLAREPFNSWIWEELPETTKLVIEELY